MTVRELGETAWRRAAFSLFAVAAGTNVPTPPLLVYRDTLGLSPDVLTAVLGADAAGLVPALLLAGPASDRLGRLVVVFPGRALPGWAVALPAPCAEVLRSGDPCVVGPVKRGRCLLDLRCVPEADDALLTHAVPAAPAEAVSAGEAPAARP